MASSKSLTDYLYKLSDNVSDAMNIIAYTLAYTIVSSLPEEKQLGAIDDFHNLLISSVDMMKGHAERQGFNAKDKEKTLPETEEKKPKRFSDLWSGMFS